MRSLVSRLATIAGMLFTFGACADSPTQLDQQRAPDLAAPVQDEQVVTPQGCVSDGLCVLPPISGGYCEPWMELDWDCDESGGECEESVGDPTDPEGSVGIQSCPGGGGDTGGGGGGGGDGGGDDPGEPCIEADTGSCSPVCEIDCEPTTEDNSICPQPLEGKTLTTLVNVAGRNHEFQFTGTMRRVNPLVGRSPAWYRISGPTASADTWWIAESGNIQLVCWGRWHFRGSLWLGTVYVNATDLHMVMGPGHPDF